MQLTTNSLSNNQTKVGLLLLVLSLFSLQVIAGSGGDAFQGVFDDLISYAEGVPGQIVAFLTVAGVIVFSMVRPNLVGLGASVVVMIVLAQLQTIITTMLTAALPVL